MTYFTYPPLRPPKGQKTEPVKPKFGRKGKAPVKPIPKGGKQ